MSNYKLNLLETRINQMQQQLDRLEGMCKRTYAFMKASERDPATKPAGWTVDTSGDTFRPLGSPRFNSSGAASPDAQLLAQIKTSPRPYIQPLTPSSPATPVSNNNNDISAEQAEEKRYLKRLKNELGERKEAAQMSQERFSAHCEAATLDLQENK